MRFRSGREKRSKERRRTNEGEVGPAQSPAVVPGLPAAPRGDDLEAEICLGERSVRRVVLDLDGTNF